MTLSDLTAKCIRCGFCLESCPTYVETGLETQSPRGRIQLVRSVEEGMLRWSDISEPLDTCLGCRACESACPSGVEYGQILEQARIGRSSDRTNRLLNIATQPMLLRAGSAVAKVVPDALLSKLIDANVVLPRAQQADTWPELDKWQAPHCRMALLDGCVMPLLFQRVREATIRLLRRCGIEPVLMPGCCGALHAHQGELEEGRRRIAAIDRQREQMTLVTDVAGCGSWAKENFDNVRDISEVLIEHGLLELLKKLPPLKLKVAYHDACHLAHGQGIRDQPRTLLGAIPGLEIVALSESDMCCGSAGLYSALQPKMARRLQERKWRNIAATGAEVVVMGNAGCQSWLGVSAPSNIEVLHTVELLEVALSGWPD